MKKFLGFLLFLVVGTGLALFATKDRIARRILTSAVETLTGFETQIRTLRFDPLRGRIHLEEVILLNPSGRGFREKVFGEAPEIHLEMNLPALFKQEKIHLRELRLHIARLHVEKNRRGVSNVSLLKALFKSGPPKSRKDSKKKVPFQLDRFVLTLTRVSYNDRSGIVPRKLTVDLHVEQQVFEGITDAKSIVQIIVMKVVSASPLANLGVNAAEVQKQLKDKVRTVRELGEKIYHEAKADVIAARTTEVGRQVLGEGKETLGQVGEAAKDGIAALWDRAREKISE